MFGWYSQLAPREHKKTRPFRWITAQCVGGSGARLATVLRLQEILGLNLWGAPARAHVGLITKLPDNSDIAAGCEVFAFPEAGVVGGGTQKFFSILRASSYVATRTRFSNTECSLSACPTEIIS